MHTFKAVVRNGRFVIDEPATLPEGSEIELEIVTNDDDLEGDDFDLLPETLAELEDRAAAAERGEVITSKELFVRLRRRMG
jgi:hypothetical protein